MEAIYVPDIIQQYPQIKAGEISFVDYRDRGSYLKNRVVFNRYAISFVLNGQKEIYRAAGNTVIRAGQAMLISEGNSIIAEHSLNEDLYHSLIVFFPGRLVSAFLLKRGLPLVAEADKDLPPFIHFANTGYINEYLRSLQMLIAQGQVLSDAVALHKVEELLLVIYEMFPAQFTALFSQNNTDGQLSLKTVVEHNLFKNLTLDELAFLANRSLSSFKRDFEKTYGLSPQKYIRDRKLEVACAELLLGKQASELYYSYGYDNVSNFNTAFKKKFGVTPATYRQAVAD